jgi:putative addiction module component (TIGR02574 family)
MTERSRTAREEMLNGPADGMLEDCRDAADETPSDVEAAWAEEIKRRIDELDAGLVSSIPADEVFARARALASTEAWPDEIRQRVEEIRNGTAELYDLEDVLAEMEARYG